MKNFQMNVKVYVGFEAGVDYDPSRVRKGKPGSRAPEFKCFNCDKWFKGEDWKYSLNKMWYPKADLKYNTNFLCGPKCSAKISPKYDKYFEV